jgi:hypothetical protein
LTQAIRSLASERWRRAALVFLLALGALLRADLIGTPFIELFSNRQIQNSIPIRLLQEGRYSLRTLPLGFNKTVVMAEFPLLPLVVIGEYRTLELLGFARLPLPGHAAGALRYYRQLATLGRLWSVTMSLLGMASLYGLVRDGWSIAAGRLALLWYALLPYPRFFDQLFITEPTMAALGTFVLYQAWRWSRSGERWRLAAAAAAFALTLLLKPSQAVLGLPLGYLFLRRHGWRAVLRPESWFFGIVALVPPFAFYTGSWVTDFNGMVFEYARTTFVDGSYASSMFRAFLRRHLWTVWSPVGSALLLIAANASARARAPGRRAFVSFLWLAFAGWFAQWFVLGPTLSGHLYYQLPSVPVAMALAGVATGWLVESLPPAVHRPLIVACALFLMAFNAIVQGSNDAGSRFWRGHWCLTVLEAGLAADRLAAPDALVVAGCRPPVDNMMMFYAHRQGYVLPVDDGHDYDESSLHALELYRQQGATLYFAAFQYDGPKFNGVVFTREIFDRLPIAGYIRARYRVIEEDDQHLVVDLTAPRPGAPALASPLSPTNP